MRVWTWPGTPPGWTIGSSRSTTMGDLHGNRQKAAAGGARSPRRAKDSNRDIVERNGIENSVQISMNERSRDTIGLYLEQRMDAEHSSRSSKRVWELMQVTNNYRKERDLEVRRYLHDMCLPCHGGGSRLLAFGKRIWIRTDGLTCRSMKSHMVVEIRDHLVGGRCARTFAISDVVERVGRAG